MSKGKRRTIDADVWQEAVRFIAREHPEVVELNRQIYTVAEALQRSRDKRTTMPEQKPAT